MNKSNTILIIIALCATITMCLSLDVVLKIRDPESFQHWLKQMTVSEATTQHYSAFISSQLLNFAFKVIIPMIFAVNTLYEFTKKKQSAIYYFLWIALLGAAMLYALSDPSNLNIVVIPAYALLLLILLSRAWLISSH